jgi:hypothetical protein
MVVRNFIGGWKLDKNNRWHYNGLFSKKPGIKGRLEILGTHLLDKAVKDAETKSLKKGYN